MNQFDGVKVSPSLLRALNRAAENIPDKEPLPTDKSSFTDRYLRTSFWHEFHESLKNNARIKNANIYKDVCSDTYFYNYFLKDPRKMSLMRTMPISSEMAYKALQATSVERLAEIIELAPPTIAGLRLLKQAMDVCDASLSVRKG